MVAAAWGLVTLVVALAAFSWLGLRVRQRGGVEDYMVARGSQPAGTLGLSFLASGLGAWVLFAPPEVGAFIGLAGVVGYALAAAGPILVLALLGPRLRRIAPAGHSLTEFVRLRYGRAFHAYVVGVSILYMWMFVTAELTAVGSATTILSGLDPRIPIVAVAAATLAYTAYGGLRASLRTDRWQAVMVLALLGLGAVAALAALPDAGGALADSGRTAIDRVGIEAAVALVIAVTAANLFHQGHWQRVWAARDDAALRRGGLLGALASIPVALVLGLLGMVAAGSGLALGDPPAPFFVLFADVGSWVVIVVLLLGISLVTSSVDTLQNGLAALVAVERPSLSLTGARATTALLMVPAVVVAVQGHSVLRVLLVADLLAATAVVPALMGLWRRASSPGALAGAIAGLAGAVLPGAVSEGSLAEGLRVATFPDSLPTMEPFLGALVASTVVAVGVSLLGRGRADLEGIDGRIVALGSGGDRH